MHLRYAWVRRLSRRRPRRSGKRKGLLWSAILGIGLALGAVLWGVGTLAGGAANGLETARSGLMLAG